MAAIVNIGDTPKDRLGVRSTRLRGMFLRSGGMLDANWRKV